MKNKVYSKCHDYLATHKRLPLFLSHGGLHLITLILLVGGIWSLFVLIYHATNKNFVVIDTSIKFTEAENNDKYPLRHFNLIFKSDSIEDKTNVRITADFKNWEDSNSYSEIADLPIEWTWIYHFPLGNTKYKFTGGGQ